MFKVPSSTPTIGTIFLTIKAREGEMSGVPPRNIKNNIQYQCIRNRLEKLMPWISGSYIPIQKLSRDPGSPPLFYQSWLIFSHSDPEAQLWGGLKADISEAFRPTKTGVRGQSPR